MELFFVSSSLCLFQVVLKEQKLYSVSRVFEPKLFPLSFKQSYFIQDPDHKIPFKDKKTRKTLFFGLDRATGSDLSCPEGFRLSPSKPQSRKNPATPPDYSNKSNRKKNKGISVTALSSSLGEPSALAKELKKQFHYYFKGKEQTFEVERYPRGTDFQEKAWTAISQTPWGQLTSYSQLAQDLKKPKAFRAVGSCCAKNPYLIVVPCHRVLSKRGLGGFALGLKIKKQLLQLEKAL